MRPAATPPDRDLAPAQIADLATLVRRAAALWPGRVAWTFDETDESFTFDEIAQLTATIAAALAQSGVGHGSRVAVLVRNQPQFPLVWLALARLGAAMVPVNVAYRSHDAGHVLRDSGATHLICSAEFDALAAELAHAVPSLEHVLHSETLAAAGEGLTAPAELDRCRPEDLVNIQYTSGTTGLPKGCQLSHRYWTVLAASLVTASPYLDEHDVMLTCQPFHYIDPQWNVLASLFSGAHLVVLDRFHPASFWDKVREYAVTYFYCLGLMPTLLARSAPSRLDRVHRVRAIQCSAIPPALHRTLEERWGVPWFEAFGMTESGADLRVGEEDHDAVVGTGCIGRPLPHRDARIVDGQGRVVPRGTTGELTLRGIGLMDGYLGHEQATATAFRDGWFHTGDLAWMDEEGRVYYAGRLKDMIRRSGENISAAEVEDVLLQHPDVALAAVVPVPDALRGEEAKAYVVPSRQDAAAVSPDELADFCAQRLAAFKVPRFWEVRATLPLTASERVAKGELRTERDDLRVGSYDRMERAWQ